MLFNSEEFEKAKPPFQDAFRKSGHTTSLSYKPTQQQRNPKKGRSRNVVWFNPPFSQHVRTNIGKEFLRLIKKYFGNPSHKLRKICNRNTSAGHRKFFFKSAVRKSATEFQFS